MTITREFYMGVHEVTQDEYMRVIGVNPSAFKDDKLRPVEKVSWSDAVKFCEALSALPAEKQAGHVYRLPTEAEWEYACRAGTSTPFHDGDSKALRNKVTRPYLGEPARVGFDKPNSFGLCDMHGNVWEWCADWYGKYDSKAQSDPKGPASGTNRVVRGGWHADGRNRVGSAQRWGWPSDLRGDDIGFRIVLEAPIMPPKKLGLTSVREFKGHTAAIKKVAFSSDGLLAVSASSDGTARVWDVKSGNEVQCFRGHGGTVFNANFLPGLTEVWSASRGGTGTLRMWAIKDGKEAAPPLMGKKDEQNEFVAYTPATDRALSLVTVTPAGPGQPGDTYALVIWDVKNGKEIHRFNPGFPSWTWSFSPDGRSFLYTGWGTVAFLCDSQSGKEIKQFHTKGPVEAAEFSMDGKRIVTGDWDGNIRLWDVQTGKEIRSWSAVAERVTAVCLSLDGRRAVSAGTDNRLRLWDVENGQEIGFSSELPKTVRSAAFSPDGRYALSGSDDPVIRLWRLPLTAEDKADPAPVEPAGKPITNSIGMKLARIPGGEFWMGQASDEQDHFKNEKLSSNEPRHKVKLTQPFMIGVTEVTQKQWKTVMGTTPWAGQRMSCDGDDYPATYVRWQDAVEFCRKLGIADGRTYRLPTEAEWEYCCRAGTTTVFSFGNDLQKLGDYAWERRNSNDLPHPVAQKKPNPWGLFDMHGNVQEWVSDWFGDYPAGPVTDPQGPGTAQQRVARGGAFWHVFYYGYRSAYRANGPGDQRSPEIGFRVVCEDSRGDRVIDKQLEEKIFPSLVYVKTAGDTRMAIGVVTDSGICTVMPGSFQDVELVTLDGKRSFAGRVASHSPFPFCWIDSDKLDLRPVACVKAGAPRKPQAAYIVMYQDGVARIHAGKIEANGEFSTSVEYAPKQMGVVAPGPIFATDGTCLGLSLRSDRDLPIVIHQMKKARE